MLLAKRCGKKARGPQQAQNADRPQHILRYIKRKYLATHWHAKLQTPYIIIAYYNGTRPGWACGLKEVMGEFAADGE